MLCNKTNISISVDRDVIKEFKKTSLNRSKFLEDCMRKKVNDLKNEEDKTNKEVK